MFILVAILIFCVLIIVHEFGHFLAAKSFGIRVNEFSVFMGPKLLQHQGKETLYSLRLLPIGGYCALEGEDGESDDPRAFASAKAWKRTVVLVAGSAMNFLLGLVILFCLYLPAQSFTTPVIDRFFEGCPYDAEDALQEGDRFLSIDGHRVYQFSDIEFLLSRNPDQVYTLELLRDGQKVTLRDFRMVKVPYVIDGEETEKYGFYPAYAAATFGTRLQAAWDTGLHFSRLIWMSLGDLFRGSVGLKDMGGVVSIVAAMNESGTSAETVSEGMQNIFYLGAFIAINLAIMNMLPIPALDGGRVFLLLVTALIEFITRKKLDPKYEGYIHAVGMVLLLIFMAVIAFLDIMKLVN